MRLQDKVAIITGGANGIGYETARLFLQEGARVAIADYDTEKGVESADAWKEDGYNAEFFQVNVADRSSVDSMVKNVLQHFGKIDILINNAGITRDAMLSKMSVEDFQAVIDVNLTGVFHCTQAVVPAMAAQGKGKIINTSSVVGVNGNVGQTNYSASKAGLIGMTKTWSKELGRKGINVNAVAPGFIDTGMVKDIPQKLVEQLQFAIPLQRLGQPQEVAKAYLFLASDDSDYVNGTVLHVDGGIMM